jgi:hypothetical protein
MEGLAQPGTAGILVDYHRRPGRRLVRDRHTAARATRFLAQIRPVLPGVTAHQP